MVPARRMLATALRMSATPRRITVAAITMGAGITVVDVTTGADITADITVPDAGRTAEAILAAAAAKFRGYRKRTVFTLGSTVSLLAGRLAWRYESQWIKRSAAIFSFCSQHLRKPNTMLNVVCLLPGMSCLPRLVRVFMMGLFRHGVCALRGRFCNFSRRKTDAND